MGSDTTQQPADAPAFAPQTDLPLAGNEAFDELERTLESDPRAIDLIVAAEAPRPVGRSWAFDWIQRRFVKPVGALGPKPTLGRETLTQWCEKALRTARGAHPVHPPGYGFEPPHGGLIGRPVGTVPPDLEARVREALTFHPIISDVDQFEYAWDENDDFLSVSCIVHLADETMLELRNVRTAVGA